MKSFLVHLASFVVMVHMTFGCSLHHGLGSAHACTNQNALSNCCSNGETKHEHSDHEHDQELPETTSFDGDDSNQNRSHLRCQDDGCDVTKVVKFVFTPLDFSTAYLGGAEDSAKAQVSTCSGLGVEPIPDCKCYAPKVRSHLLFSIQLI